MFTGIVAELGKVTELEPLAGFARLTVSGPLLASAVRPGESIAVNGVCLTVTHSDSGQFTVDVIGETLARSSLGTLSAGGPVNLERPVAVDGHLDGHMVQGHVDGTGVITERRLADGWNVLRIKIPADLVRFVAHKGSIAVDGVSLTVSAVSPLSAGSGQADGWLEVSLIPETVARTTLGTRAVGDIVNIEVDVIAKYVERLLTGGAR